MVASGELFVGLVNRWILGAGGSHKLDDLSVLYVFHLVDVRRRCRFRDRILFLQGPHLPAIAAHAGRNCHGADSSRRHTELTRNENSYRRRVLLSLSIFDAIGESAGRRVPEDREGLHRAIFALGIRNTRPNWATIVLMAILTDYSVEKRNERSAAAKKNFAKR